MCVCVCVCVWERKKITALKLLSLFLRYIRNVNVLLNKYFQSAELLTKTSFFLYFRDRPKNGEGSNKQLERIIARVTKHASKKLAKAEVILNCSLWIEYEQLLKGCFDCIFTSMDGLAYLILISLSFHEFFMSWSTWTA